jgi:hypothetical protein
MKIVTFGLVKKVDTPCYTESFVGIDESFVPASISSSTTLKYPLIWN